jgi:hypothetical protein
MLGRALLVVWFASMVLLGAGLLSRHLVALPRPNSSSMEAALAALRSESERNRWLAVHVLYSGCRCSERIAEHLAHTRRPDDWSEIVLWVGEEAPPAALSHFDVRRITTAELATLGIEAAPSLVVLDPRGRALYAGGYTSRKQGPAIEDRRILDDARHGRSITALPVFGCAVSSRLQSELEKLPTP